MIPKKKQEENVMDSTKNIAASGPTKHQQKSNTRPKIPTAFELSSEVDAIKLLDDGNGWVSQMVGNRRESSCASDGSELLRTHGSRFNG